MDSEQPLYKIGHLTKTLGITSRTIRYYDQIGLLPHVKRSRGNIRLFDDEDIRIIKKILTYQNQDQLALEEIRNRLFGKKKLDKITSCVLTDVSSCIPGIYLDSMNIVMYINKVAHTAYPDQLYTPTIQEYLEEYNMLTKEGNKHIYAITMSKIFSNASNNAVEAKKQYKGEAVIEVIEAPGIGSSVGLFVIELAQAILDRCSQKEIDLLISKQVMGVRSFIILDSIKSLLNKNQELSKQSFFYSEVINIRPIVKFNARSQKYKVVDFVSNMSEGVKKLIENIVESIEVKGNYVKRVLITYTGDEKNANSLGSHLQKILSEISIDILQQHRPLNQFTGNKSLTVSIL